MKNWAVAGNLNYLRDTTGMIPKLRPGIYRLEIDPNTDEFLLAFVQNQFDFPYKVYNKDIDFVERVKKTYDNTTGNLGILLNGIKGTGKTVTAELICNSLKLPVILVNKPYKNVAAFFNDIHEDVVIVFDEFEKTFDTEKEGINAAGDILSIMDGVLNGISRKVFLLTTNNKNINSNLIDRPSRIRYVREYNNLDVNTIIEIIDDKLTAIQFRDQAIKFVSELSIITIDIVKTVIEEINIHEQNPYDFVDYLNVSVMENKYSITKVEKGEDGRDKETVICWSAIILDQFHDVSNIEQWDALEFYWKKNKNHGWNTLGHIKKVIDSETIVVTQWEYEDNDGKDHWKDVIYKFEKVDNYHSEFRNFRQAI